MPKDMLPLNYDQACTVSAISAEFHADKRYQHFYDTHKDEVGGFPGLWNLCVDAAIVFLREAEGVEYEYIEAIDQFVAEIYKFNRVPTNEEFRQMAHAALGKAEQKEKP